MSLANIQLFSALTEKMKWHQTRQSLLAENVANAETPGFKGRDLTAFEFGDPFAAKSSVGIATVATSPMHFQATSQGFEGGPKARQLNNFEITPEGNGVTLEDEMMKVTGNQMDYDTVASLYTKSIKIIRTALGKTA